MSRKKPKYKVGQVIMDTINDVPRKISGRGLDTRGVNLYWDYYFAGCAIRLDENRMRRLTKKEIG